MTFVLKQYAYQNNFIHFKQINHKNIIILYILYNLYLGLAVLSMYRRHTSISINW